MQSFVNVSSSPNRISSVVIKMRALQVKSNGLSDRTNSAFPPIRVCQNQALLWSARPIERRSNANGHIVLLLIPGLLAQVDLFEPAAFFQGRAHSSVHAKLLTVTLLLLFALSEAT